MLDSMSGMNLQVESGMPVNHAVMANNNACPQSTHSRNATNQLHCRLLNVVRSKNTTLRKSKSLFFRIPFEVSVLSKVDHTDPISHCFEIISTNGEILTISSPNKKLLTMAKCSLVDSMKVMRNHLKPIKTPKQMAQEAGWF